MTCYAWGRFWEIGGGGADIRPTLSTGNAEDWFNYNDGYERSQTPALGSVLCMADGPYSGDGHVAVVEEIHPDGSITISESAWQAYYFKTERLYPPYIIESGYIFQGFILNPHGGGQPIPPTEHKRLWYFKRKLWRIDKELFD